MKTTACGDRGYVPLQTIRLSMRLQSRLSLSSSFPHMDWFVPFHCFHISSFFCLLRLISVNNGNPVTFCPVGRTQTST